MAVHGITKPYRVPSQAALYAEKAYPE